jgi:hypothetical protein
MVRSNPLLDQGRAKCQQPRHTHYHIGGPDALVARQHRRRFDDRVAYDNDHEPAADQGRGAAAQRPVTPKRVIGLYLRKHSHVKPDKTGAAMIVTRMLPNIGMPMLSPSTGRAPDSRTRGQYTKFRIGNVAISSPVKIQIGTAVDGIQRRTGYFRCPVELNGFDPMILM